MSGGCPQRPSPLTEKGGQGWRSTRGQGLTAACLLLSPFSFRPWCRTPWLPNACARRAPCLRLLPLPPHPLRTAGPGPPCPSPGRAAVLGAAPACGRAAPVAAPVSSRFLNGLVCCNHRLRLLPPSRRTGGTCGTGWGGGRGLAGGGRGLAGHRGNRKQRGWPRGCGQGRGWEGRALGGGTGGFEGELGGTKGLARGVSGCGARRGLGGCRGAVRF